MPEILTTTFEFLIKNADLFFAAAGTLTLAFSIVKQPDGKGFWTDNDGSNKKYYGLIHQMRFRIALVLISISFLIQITQRTF